MARLCVKMETALQHDLSQSLCWHWGRFAKILVLALPETSCLSLPSTAWPPDCLGALRDLQLTPKPFRARSPFCACGCFSQSPPAVWQPSSQPSPHHSPGVAALVPSCWGLSPCSCPLATATQSAPCHWPGGANREKKRERWGEKAHIQALVPGKSWLPSISAQKNLCKETPAMRSWWALQILMDFCTCKN